MTNNEAISKIKFLLDVGGSDGFTSADIDALNMAINSLSEKTTAQPKSNADRIRQMTDEELAALLLWNVCTVCDGRGFEKCGDDKYCRKHVAKWLKQEVSEDAES